MSKHGKAQRHEAQAAPRGGKHGNTQPKREPAMSRRVINISADADMTSCEQVRALFLRCRRLIREGGGAMVIDLHNVTHADTKLAACLVAVYQLARDSSVRLELTASRPVLDTVELCRLHWLIERTAPTP